MDTTKPPQRSKERFERCIDDCYWKMEPISPGSKINLFVGPPQRKDCEPQCKQYKPLTSFINFLRGLN